MEQAPEEKKELTLEERLAVLEKESEEKKKTKDAYAIPVAIVIAGIFIAGSMFIQSSNTPTVASGTADAIKEVTAKDHIRGDIDAPVKIVEFSDTECPFCKRHHETMKNIMKTYGARGEVAWVYRHFPLDSLHRKARIEARATECAAELGGNEAFWMYTDMIFIETPANDGLDLDLLPVFAERIGLNKSEFESCLESTKHDKVVEEHYQDALATGGKGTPYTIIIAPNGKKFVLSGAQPEASIASLIDLALQEVK